MCKRTESHCKGPSLAAVLAVWLLAGCGGGGGGDKASSAATGNAGGGTQVEPGTGSGSGTSSGSASPSSPGTAGPGVVQALAISAVPAGQVMVGAVYSLQPQVRHVSGVATYSIENLPEWADFDAATGRLVGVPSSKHAGITRAIVIAVQDARQRVSLTPFAITVVPRPALIELPSTPLVEETTPGRVVLSWDVPTLTDEQTSLPNLEGYRVHHGLHAEAMVHAIDLQGSGNNQLVLDDLDAGRHYFAVRAVRAGGEVSMLSNIVSRQVK